MLDFEIMSKILNFKCNTLEFKLIDMKHLNAKDVEDISDIFELKINVVNVSKTKEKDEIFDLKIVVPREIGNTVKYSDSLRISITSAKERMAIKVFNNELVIYNFSDRLSIKYPKEIIVGTSKISLPSLLHHYELDCYIDEKVYEHREDTISNEDWETINNWVIPDIAIKKLTLIFEDLEITNKLDKKNLKYLMRVLLEKEKQVITPLDYIYLNTTSGLKNDLLRSTWEIRRGLSSKYFQNGKLYTRDIQNAINKYYNYQAKQFRNIQAPSNSNSLTIQSQSKKIYFYRQIEDNLKKQRLYNNYFVGVLDPIRTAETANTSIYQEISNCTRITDDNEIMIKVVDKNFKEVELSYYNYAISTILSMDNIDYDKKRIFPDENGEYSVYTFGKYKKIKDLNKIDYLRHEESLLSPSTSVIPWINRTGTIRTLLGAAMGVFKQFQ